MNKKYLILIIGLLFLGGLVFYQNQGNKQPLGGGIGELPPAFNRVASTTMFIAPFTTGIGYNQIIFGTSSRRIFLSLHATSSAGLVISLNDLPCTEANAAFILNGSTTNPFILVDATKLYTGAIRVCGLTATSSILGTQAIYNP